MLRTSRHHLLLLLSLLPSLMVVAHGSAGRRAPGVAAPALRALQEETNITAMVEEEDHDHEGDGAEDHAAEDHSEEELHDHDGDGVLDHTLDEHMELMEEEGHDDHDDHDHDDHDEVEFEWAGVFHLEPGKSYVLTLKPPAHDDHDDEDDHEGHDHLRFLQTEGEEEDHDHDGDGVEDHAAEDHDDHDHDGDGIPDHAPEDHSVLLDEDYFFFLAVVPVEEHGQEGIDQAMAALDMEVIKEVESGAIIMPTVSNIFELLFPSEKDSMVDPIIEANTTDLPAVTARAGHIASNGVQTVIIEVPASETKEDFVIMLPGKPSEVAGSDKIIAESETGEKLVPEEVRVLSASEAIDTAEAPASAAGFQLGSAFAGMTALLMSLRFLF